MTDKKKSWDDIPSLDGLKVDKQYKAETPLGKRKYERMTAGDMISILEVKKIRAKVVTGKHTVDGLLSDICADGLALILKKELSVNQYVNNMSNLDFFLENKKLFQKQSLNNQYLSKTTIKLGFSSMVLTRRIVDI